MVVTPRKARLNAVVALSSALGLCALVALIALLSLPFTTWLWSLLPIALVGAAVFALMTRKYRRRRRVVKQPFPKEWKTILRTRVAFYNTLSEEEKQRFREEMQIFLDEKRITGIKTEVDEATRVLVAASAIIPIFGFPEWEYSSLGEILIYPGSFDGDYQFEGKRGNILGVVHSRGPLSNVMILSKPDVQSGYTGATDMLNVGIHEFVHLIDKADGAIDGVPATMDRELVKPWLHLVHEKMNEIARGRSDIRAYALKNEQEFLAVVSEYFFENPMRLKARHPRLYAMLEKAFNQDMASRITTCLKEVLFPHGRRIGRNADCPCGSGEKFKKCCLEGTC
jgi:Mlc titration factor MtfA (ptsG expression regulator)